MFQVSKHVYLTCMLDLCVMHCDKDAGDVCGSGPKLGPGHPRLGSQVANRPVLRIPNLFCQQLALQVAVQAGCVTSEFIKQQLSHCLDGVISHNSD